MVDISELARWMTRGGDARILLDPATGLNRYHSAPFPRDVLAFASSTANDISAEAAAWLQENVGKGASALEEGATYADFLDQMRGKIRRAYALPRATDIFIAPSGTDLEYIALLAVARRRAGGIANLLLGADEVGSGCIYSAAGKYFAGETALGVAVRPDQSVSGLPDIQMGDFPVRSEAGEAHNSSDLIAQMEARVSEALDADRYPLVHIVHGSKTGLVLPHLDDIDRLRTRFGADIAFVVDACQARITTQAIHDYLARGVIVFLTGSKFMGGPPFSGWALLPAGIVEEAAPLASGMATIFRRAEVPLGWAGRETCPDQGNTGLALRLAASLFELERFQALAIDRVTRVVSAFNAATSAMADSLGVCTVAAAPSEDADEVREHPIEMQTLVTLDLCHDRSGQQTRNLDFDAATRIHKAMIAHGVRLGQPVRCVRLGNGDWGATLRVGLSMPQVAKLDAMDDDAMHGWLDQAMERVAKALSPLLV